MPEETPFVLSHSIHFGAFSPELFMEIARKLFSNINTGEKWIRSGRYIPEAYKSAVSSYRLMGRHLPRSGKGRVDIVHVKLAPNASLERSSKQWLAFLRGCAASGNADGMLAAVSSSADEKFAVLLMEPPCIRRITIPDDVMDFMCLEGIKNYIRKSCGISTEALDGYFSTSRLLYDDSVIARNAGKIDEALSEMSFCDIASSDGKIVAAFTEKIVSVRAGLGRYFGAGNSINKDKLAERFINNSLWATDCSEAALDILKAFLSMKYPKIRIDADRFVWGSVLIEDILSDKKFDLIISNPPHLRGEQFSVLKELLTGYSSSEYGADLYCYYVEKAASMLSEKGCAVFLISNKWRKAKYGEGLRSLFAASAPSIMVDLPNDPHATGAVLPLSVVVFCKENEKNETVRYVDASVMPAGSSIAEYVEYASAQPCAGAERSADTWDFTGRAGSIEAEIGAKSISLVDCVGGEIYRGILTGLNEAFVIDAATANVIAETEKPSARFIVPFYSGRDVKRYYLPQAKKNLIFIRKGTTDKERGDKRPDCWLVENHQLLALHLAKYEQKAAKRRDKGDYWWELRSCAYSSVFEKPKIILPVITKRLSAVLSDKAAYVNDKCFVIAGGDYFLLALLNSKLMDYIFRAQSSPLMNGYYELRRSTLASLPVRRVSSSKLWLKEEIAEAGKKLSELYAEHPPSKYGKTPQDITEIERQLDRSVFRLYGISPSLVKIIENN